MIEKMLREHWMLQPPYQVEQVTTGINNLTYLVRTDGDEYFLKRYQNIDADTRIGFEQAFLRALAQTDLPFAVPAPVLTVTGEPIARIPEGWTFGLTRRIPGQPGWRGDPDFASKAGHALAILDLAMAQMEFDSGIEIPSMFGALVDGHPAISDLNSAIRDTFMDMGVRTAIETTLAIAELRWRTSTAGWPTQVIHADYFPANVLASGGDVSGVLDFEFAGINHRAMDFAIGLVAFGSPGQKGASTWAVMEAFASGYLRACPLSDDERSAVPDLVLMREAGSFVHWLGRMKQGLVSQDDIQNRGRRLLDLRAWLDMHGQDLVDRLAPAGWA